MQDPSIATFFSCSSTHLLYIYLSIYSERENFYFLFSLLKKKGESAKNEQLRWIGIVLSVNAGNKQEIFSF